MADAPEQVDILIVGGGLGGLAAGVGFYYRGYNIAVLEAANEFRTSTATIVGLGGNSFTALEMLHPGIVPLIRQSGTHVSSLNSYTIVDKADPAKTTHASRPASTEVVTVRWAEVQRILVSLLPDAVKFTGYRATGFTEHPDTGTVSVHFRDRPDVTARLVVAADGVRSAMRAAMNIPGDTGPRYLGHMNWNAVLYNPGKSVVDWHGSFTTMAHGNTDDNPFDAYAMVIEAGPEYTFWQLRVPSDEPSFTEPPASPSQSDQQSATAQPDPSWGITSGNTFLVGGGLGRPGSKQRVLAMMRGCGMIMPAKLVEATPESAIFERAMIDRIPLDELGATMTSTHGRVFLIGDAAHAMHSGPGQGARTAFEDAAVLMTLIESQRESLQSAGWSITTPPDTALLESSSVSSKPAEEATLQDVAQDEKGTALRAGNAVATVAAQVENLVLHGEKIADRHVGSSDGHCGGLGKQAPDSDVIASVGQQYNSARLTRTCRVQKYSAEGCGLQSLRTKYRVPGLSAEQTRQRFFEFVKWVGQFPENPHGDPNSTYFKPM